MTPPVPDAAASADHVGRRRVEADEISSPLCKRLAALLDVDPDSVRNGDELPFGWSAILFSTISPQSALGPDGHAAEDAFLPPAPLPLRMFAGREMVLHRPLRIGQSVERTSTIEAITPKQGRNGRLVFVTLRHDVANADGLAITERQNIVYREDLPETVPEARREPALPAASWREAFTADPTALFRYSALTFNAHRIHYDMPYATIAEGYPSLVINGGYTTLKLLELFRTRLAGALPSSYVVRAIRPLFLGRTHSLHGAPTPEGAMLWACDDEGRIALKIEMRVAA